MGQVGHWSDHGGDESPWGGFPFFSIITFPCLLPFVLVFLSLFSIIYLAKVFPGSRQKLHKFFNNHDYAYVATLCMTQYPVLDIEITIDIFRCGRCLCAKGPTQQVQSWEKYCWRIFRHLFLWSSFGRLLADKRWIVISNKYNTHSVGIETQWNKFQMLYCTKFTIWCA